MTTAGQVRLDNTAYRSFELPARRRVRAETYGEDMGQNGWPTKDAWRVACDCLGLTAESRVLSVALARMGRTSISLARSAPTSSASTSVRTPGAGRRAGRRRLITRAVTRQVCGALVHHDDEVQRSLAGERVATRRPPGGGLASTTCRRSR